MPVVPDNPAAGDQLYVSPVVFPEAVSVVDCPWQRVSYSGLTFIVGDGITLTVVCAVSLQFCAVEPITV